MKWLEEHGFEKIEPYHWKRNIGGMTVVVRKQSENDWRCHVLDSMSGMCNGGTGNSSSEAVGNALSNTKEVLSRLHTTFLAIESVFRNNISYDEAWKEISQGGE